MFNQRWINLFTIYLPLYNEYSWFTPICVDIFRMLVWFSGVCFARTTHLTGFARTHSIFSNHSECIVCIWRDFYRGFGDFRILNGCGPFPNCRRVCVIVLYVVFDDRGEVVTAWFPGDDGPAAGTLSECYLQWWVRRGWGN